MGRLEYHALTQRRLPHFQPLAGTLFVTFRLAGSIPQSRVRSYQAKRKWLREQLRRVNGLETIIRTAEHANWVARLEQLNREWFLKCEEILHLEAVGPTWL